MAKDLAGRDGRKHRNAGGAKARGGKARGGKADAATTEAHAAEAAEAAEARASAEAEEARAAAASASERLDASSVAQVQSRLSELWAKAAAARLEAAQAQEAERRAQVEAAARAAAALAASDGIDAEGRHVAARSSVLNLVVIAGDRETADRCAKTIAATAGRHPSRSLIISEVDPNAPSGLEASIETVASTTASGHRAETGAETVHIAARGETGKHLASIIVPLLVHDLPVAMWWPGRPTFLSHRADRLLPIADRLIVDGSEWEGNGLELLIEMGQIANARRPGLRGMANRPLVVVDFALLRQARWREALASVYDLPDLRQYLGAVRAIDVTYAAREAGDPDSSTNVVRPLYHIAWLGSRLGMTVLEPLRASREGHRAATLKQRDHEVAVTLRPATSDLGQGSTVRVEMTSRLRGSELSGVVTAGDCTVEVVITDCGRERVRRVYNAPRLNDVDLLSRAVEEDGADPLGLEVLDMARRILGADSRTPPPNAEDFGTSVGEPWSRGASVSGRPSGAHKSLGKKPSSAQGSRT